mmetsp:Transcript_17971/g.23643  ORF Transcript_17971/g.23643 Transcript_17971/m.23643 type:complete len:81 (-) Transcript_17971:1079-1321(-)
MFFLTSDFSLHIDGCKKIFLKNSGILFSTWRKLHFDGMPATNVLIILWKAGMITPQATIEETTASISSVRPQFTLCGCEG